MASELLAEQFIAGRELTVGIVGDTALPVIEIVARQDFYNFENKYPFLNPNAAGADHFCPAALDEATTACAAIALAAHRALDLQVYSRVDLLLTDKSERSVRAGSEHDPRHDPLQPAAGSRRSSWASAIRSFARASSNFRFPDSHCSQ